ncbi:MAG: hypothetical protein R2737_02020 [Candidatus Nanopelagicales bacterium]
MPVLHRGALAPRPGEDVADTVTRVRADLRRHGIGDAALAQAVDLLRRTGAPAVRILGDRVEPLTDADVVQHPWGGTPSRPAPRPGRHSASDPHP